MAPTDRYYVSFDNVKVGELIGQGFVDCIDGVERRQAQRPRHERRPHRQQRPLFAEGYNGVLKPKFDAGTYVKVGEPAGTWTPSEAATTFEQQYTANPNINAAWSRRTTTTPTP